jgi:predicted ATPase
VLSRVQIKGYKSLRDVSLPFDRFTVLVGANASGKSSVLDAVDLAHRLIDDTSREAAAKEFAEEGQWVISTGPERRCAIQVWTAGGARTDIAAQSVREDGLTDVFMRHVAEGRASSDTEPAFAAPQRLADFGEGVFGVSARLRLDANRLAAPCAVQLLNFGLSPDGSGLATELQEAHQRREGRLEEIERLLTQVVPSIRQIRVRSTVIQRPALLPGVEVEARLSATDSWVRARELSEGTLLTLGILTVLHSGRRQHLLLLDDIDRGLHPRAQREIVQLVRKIVDNDPQLQVVCTTHSPYVVDEFEPESVVVLKLDDGGATHARRLSEHPDIDQWRKMMQAGEFWSSVGEDWVFG